MNQNQLIPTNQENQGQIVHHQPNQVQLPTHPTFHVNYDDVMADIVRKVD
jgi:hypothetical protein